MLIVDKFFRQHPVNDGLTCADAIKNPFDTLQLGEAHAARVETAENKSVTPTEPSDAQVEAALLHLVNQRGPLSSACPSEVARALSPTTWRALMPQVRRVAGLLAQSGLLDIAQRGQSVPASGPWKGPIRVRLPPMHR